MKKFILTAMVLICGNCVFCADAQIYKLDNGQTLIIQEVKNNPIVTIDTWIKTGSIDEVDENSGVAHFLEHLFFKGTKNHEAGEFDRILETKGAITNAATSKDFTHYYVTIPSKDFDLALDLHSDMILNPLIPRNEMERERKVVLEEINKDLVSPSRIMHDNLSSMLYKNHPYKRRVIGNSEVIETITRDNVLKFYNTNYYPSNMITIILGDVDTQHVLEKVKEKFNAPCRKVTKNTYVPEPPLKEQQKKVAYIDTQSGYMVIGFRSVPIDNNDNYALDVLATILGEGRSSILNQTLKEKKRLAFSVDAGNTTYKEDGIFYVSANFEPEKCKSVEDTIFDEIKKIQTNGVADEQLSLAKNLIERSTFYSRESITNIATEIGYTVALTNDLKFYNNYLANIQNVTKEDVKKVANKYLGENKSAVSIVLPKDLKDIPVANIKKEKQFSGATLVSEKSGTQKYQLDNKSTLLYTPNTVNDIIAINIISKGGQLLDNIAGTGKLAAMTLLKGTEEHTALELSQILEDNGIKISPSVSADSFTINILTTKDEYDKTLELLDEIINHPSFDSYEIEKVKANKLSSIKHDKDSALQVAVQEYRNLIYKNTPYSISSKVLEENMSKITREDIVKYYNSILNPQNIVISINGNINKDKTIEKLNSIFNKTSDETKFNYTDNENRITKITSKRETLQKMNTETAWILLGWQVNGVLNEKDYATLQVIDSLLGSGMSSRLFIDLREQEGLAYQLGSGYSSNVLRGSFMLYIGTNPNTLEKAKKGLFNEIDKLKNEYVGDKELADAKEKLLGNYIIGLETNLDKASTIGWYEASGRGYEFKENYPQLINSVTETDIIEVANKYFNENYILSVVTKL